MNIRIWFFRSVRFQLAALMAVFYGLHLSRGLPPGTEYTVGTRLPLVLIIAIVVTTVSLIWSAGKHHASLVYSVLRFILGIVALVAFFILPMQIWGMGMAIVLALAALLGSDERGVDRQHIAVILSSFLFIVGFYYAVGEQQVWNSWFTPLGGTALFALLHLVTVCIVQFVMKSAPADLPPDDDDDVPPATPTAPTHTPPAATHTPTTPVAPVRSTKRGAGRRTHGRYGS